MFACMPVIFPITQVGQPLRLDLARGAERAVDDVQGLIVPVWILAATMDGKGARTCPVSELQTFA